MEVGRGHPSLYLSIGGLMRIKGFIKTSLVDWDGKITSVLFLPNCNFRCPMCHNYGLVLDPDRYPDVDYLDMERYLIENRDFIDGVVITGGEPTLSNDLEDLCKNLKEIGMRVKLDTNGYLPDKLAYLIDKELVDYVAMDVKAPLREEIYSKLAGVSIDIARIERSIEIIKDSGLGYEFRTTVVPPLLTGRDIIEIAKSLSPAERYVLQQFNPENAMSEEMRKVKPYDKEFLKEISIECKRYIKEVVVRA